MRFQSWVGTARRGIIGPICLWLGYWPPASYWTLGCACCLMGKKTVKETWGGGGGGCKDWL